MVEEEGAISATEVEDRAEVDFLEKAHLEVNSTHNIFFNFKFPRMQNFQY